MKELCNGKIDSSGICERCYEVSQTTSAYCSRLIDVEQNEPQIEGQCNLWQICPKCKGQGLVWFPADIPYNETYSSNGTPFKCDVCQGEKIISTITGEPPWKVYPWID